MLFFISVVLWVRETQYQSVFVNSHNTKTSVTSETDILLTSCVNQASFPWRLLRRKICHRPKIVLIETSFFPVPILHPNQVFLDVIKNNLPYLELLHIQPLQYTPDAAWNISAVLSSSSCLPCLASWRCEENSDKWKPDSCLCNKVSAHTCSASAPVELHSASSWWWLYWTASRCSSCVWKCGYGAGWCSLLH